MRMIEKYIGIITEIFGGTTGAVVTALSLIVSIVTVIVLIRTYRKEQKTKRYEFIADYNFHFLTSEEFLSVERKLEACYQCYSKAESVDRDYPWLEQKFDEIFGTKQLFFLDYTEVQNEDERKRLVFRFGDNNQLSKDYQQIVNYLVYLEAFVPLIKKGIIKFRDVDDLFGYRYFIAMNNPVLQRNELFKEAQYYQGCISIYEKWKKYRKSRNHAIPMKGFDFTSEYYNNTNRKQKVN